jgi:hypothetical protein
MNLQSYIGAEPKRLMDRLVLNIPAELLKILNDTVFQFYIAGGVFVSLITGQKITDLDFFFVNQDDALKAFSAVRSDRLFSPGPVTFNCYNFTFAGKKIQFITKAFGESLADVLSQFDFRAVMFGADKEMIEKRYYWAEQNAMQDIAARTLTVMPGHRHPFYVSGRIAKYMHKKGFTCPPRSFVRLILQQLVRAQSVKTLGDVRDEILGLDTLILEKFFKSKAEKWPEGKSVAETELKDLMVDIDEYFESRLSDAALAGTGEGEDQDLRDEL